MAWHYMPARRRLSRALVLPGPRVRETYLLHAGKMFFTLHANIISACCKNVFYRIGEHRAGSRWRGPAPRHGLAAEGMAWRPKAWPGGQRQRPAAESKRPAAGRPAGRTSNACGESYPAIKIKDEGSAPVAIHAPQSSLTSAAGPCCWRARSCCPCRCPGSGSGSGLWPLAPAPALAAEPGSCLGLCSAW